MRACKVTDYYGILELKKGCEDNEVKKAYRKVRLSAAPVQSAPRAYALHEYSSHSVPRSPY